MRKNMQKWREFSGKIKDLLRINIIKDYIISYEQPDVVFIWIPKSAGTSIYNAIGARKFKTTDRIKNRFCGRGIVTFGHMNYFELLNQGYLSEKFDKRAFKFVIVRDPYDRAVSLYEYLKSRKKHIHENESFLNFLQRLNKNGIDPIGLYSSNGTSHCNPQIRWVEKINIDFVGRFENLEQDLQSIKSKIELSTLTIPRKNASRRKETSSYYCTEARELVEHIYREDFKFFSYKKYMP
jgi:hypothetical protein